MYSCFEFNHSCAGISQYLRQKRAETLPVATLPLQLPELSLPRRFIPLWQAIKGFASILQHSRPGALTDCPLWQLRIHLRNWAPDSEWVQTTHMFISWGIANNFLIHASSSVIYCNLSWFIFAQVSWSWISRNMSVLSLISDCSVILWLQLIDCSENYGVSQDWWWMVLNAKT